MVMLVWVFSLTCFIVLACFLYTILKTVSKWLVYYKRTQLSGQTTEHLSKHVDQNGRFRSAVIENGSSWETRRDMGHYESFLAEQDVTRGTNIYAVISLKSKVSLRRELVQNALILLCRKHPLLRSIVDVRARDLSFYENVEAFASERKQFVALGDRDFCPELRFVNTSHWKIVLEEELSLHKTDCSARGHLWRTILLREHYHANEDLYKNTLLFFFDQVIMDRHSILQFIKDFKKFICKLFNCDIHISDITPLQLQDCTEDLIKAPRFWKLLYFQLKERFHFHFATTTQRSKRLKKKQKSVFHTRSLSTEETMDLLNYIFKSKCSLSLLFIGAWLELEKRNAINGHIPKAVFKKPVSIVVDFRESLVTPLPPSSLGNYSSNIFLNCTTSVVNKCKSSFWANIEDCNKQLRYALQQEKHLEAIWGMDHFNVKKTPCFEIADVGQINFVDNYPFLLEDVYIGASETSNVSLTLVVVNNKLCCGLHVTSDKDKTDSNHSDLLNNLLLIVMSHTRHL